MKDNDVKSGTDTSPERTVIKETGAMKQNFPGTFYNDAVELNDDILTTKDNNYVYKFESSSNYSQMYTNESSTNSHSDLTTVDASNRGTLNNFTKDILPKQESQRSKGSCSQLVPKLESEEDYSELAPIEPKQAHYLENLRNEFKDMPVMMFYNIVRLWYVQQALGETED